MNHAAKGITDKDFDLARKIEEVIMRQPGFDDESDLEGTPDDPRFKYYILSINFALKGAGRGAPWGLS